MCCQMSTSLLRDTTTEIVDFVQVEFNQNFLCMSICVVSLQYLRG